MFKIHTYSSNKDNRTDEPPAFSFDLKDASHYINEHHEGSGLRTWHSTHLSQLATLDTAELTALLRSGKAESNIVQSACWWCEETLQLKNGIRRYVYFERWQVEYLSQECEIEEDSSTEDGLKVVTVQTEAGKLHVYLQVRTLGPWYHYTCCHLRGAMWWGGAAVWSWQSMTWAPTTGVWLSSAPWPAWGQWLRGVSWCTSVCRARRLAPRTLTQCPASRWPQYTVLLSGYGEIQLLEKKILRA